VGGRRLGVRARVESLHRLHRLSFVTSARVESLQRCHIGRHRKDTPEPIRRRLSCLMAISCIIQRFSKSQLVVILFAVAAYFLCAHPGYEYAYDGSLKSAPSSQGLLAPAGRYSSALSVEQLDFPSHPNPWLDPMWRFLRLKRWHYTSLVAGDLLLGFAIFHGSYVSQVFVYVTRTTATDGERWEYSSMMPLGMGVAIAPGSRQGCTSAESLLGSSRIHVCAQPNHGWKVELQVPVFSSSTGKGARLDADFVIAEPTEPLSLLIPLRGTAGQLGYTLKAGGLLSKGKLKLTIEGEELSQVVNFDDGLAAVDWTKQLAKRETVWKWVSVSAKAAVRAAAGGNTTSNVGINFSVGEFDDAAGIAQENAVWVDGKLSLLGSVNIVPPEADLASEEWRIRTARRCEAQCDPGACGCVDLRFTPRGARRDGLDLGFIKSVFVQPYGSFSGLLRLADGTYIELEPKSAFGVTEDHHAIW